MRVFADANVLFSASNAGSPIARLCNMVCQRGTLVSSDLAVEEARRNVALKRPTWQNAFETLLGKTETVPTVRFRLPVELPDKDIPILCAAIHADCDILVTGDKRHFGHLYDQTVHDVTIVSVLRLAEVFTAAADE